LNVVGAVKHRNGEEQLSAAHAKDERLGAVPLLQRTPFVAGLVLPSSVQCCKVCYDKHTEKEPKRKTKDYRRFEVALHFSGFRVYQEFERQ
jgi:hypothetical protein